MQPQVQVLSPGSHWLLLKGDDVGLVPLLFPQLMSTLETRNNGLVSWLRQTPRTVTGLANPEICCPFYPSYLSFSFNFRTALTLFQRLTWKSYAALLATFCILHRMRKSILNAFPGSWIEEYLELPTWIPFHLEWWHGHFILTWLCHVGAGPLESKSFPPRFTIALCLLLFLFSMSELLPALISLLFNTWCGSCLA